MAPTVTARLFNGDVRAHYHLGATLGRGTFGKVKVGTPKVKVQGGQAEPVAIKIMDASNWTPQELEDFYRECFILAQVRVTDPRVSNVQHRRLILLDAMIRSGIPIS